MTTDLYYPVEIRPRSCNEHLPHPTRKAVRTRHYQLYTNLEKGNKVKPKLLYTNNFTTDYPSIKILKTLKTKKQIRII